MGLMRIDFWLIGRFEKFAHWFQRHTGKTNYFLCAVCIWLYIISMVVEVSLRMFLQKRGFDWLAMIYVLLALFYVTHLLLGEEARAFERIQTRVANPFKVSPVQRFVRMTSVFFLVFRSVALGISLFSAALSFAHLWATMVIYLLACDPLPPCRGKLWDTVGAFFAKPVPIKNNP